MNNKTAKTKKYVDQVEVVICNHLTKSKHKTTECDVLDHVTQLFKLNTEQDRAFHIVAQYLMDVASEQLKMYIGGMGGTGKSQVLKALIEFFKQRQESGRLVCVAPTGTAAAIVKESTYHFTFGINEFTESELSKKGMAEVKTRLMGVEYVFLDEVSMLLCSDLFKISSRLAACLN
ncbi:hypothetical protein IW262DRAFT_1277721 [Armillaria fumosa]|nr:hypothetical protein IW262DRAFT_1277721 [Armillaria fumosa]